MKIVTGKTGTPHVTSRQFRGVMEGIIGQDSYIITHGENLEPELVTNNKLKIKSGMMCHHGNISTVEIGTYDEVTIQNGTQGMKRIDLVVNRYTKDEGSGIEENSWIVIQGTPAAEDPIAPSYTEGNLQEGDLVDDCPVFEVHLDGINVTEVKKLLSVTPDMSTLNADLSELLAYDEEELADGVTITRCGRHRVLQISNASSPTAGDIARVPSKDMPSAYVMGSAAYRGQTQGDYFISITPRTALEPGKVGLFRGNNAAISVDGPYIVAHIDWYVSP